MEAEIAHVTRILITMVYKTRSYLPYSAFAFPPCSYSTIYSPVCQFAIKSSVFTDRAALFLASSNSVEILFTRSSYSGSMGLGD